MCDPKGTAVVGKWLTPLCTSSHCGAGRRQLPKLLEENGNCAGLSWECWLNRNYILKSPVSKLAVCTSLEMMELVSPLCLVKPYCEEHKVGFLLGQSMSVGHCRQALCQEEVLARREPMHPLCVVVGVIPGGLLLSQCCVFLTEIPPVPGPLTDRELWLD